MPTERKPSTQAARPQKALTVEQAAELKDLPGNSVRLKLLYLLDNMGELTVSDLAELSGVSVSAASQHLSKLKAYKIVRQRRDAKTIYYSLTDHPSIHQIRKQLYPLAEMRGATRPPDPNWDDEEDEEKLENETDSPP